MSKKPFIKLSYETISDMEKYGWNIAPILEPYFEDYERVVLMANPVNSEPIPFVVYNNLSEVEEDDRRRAQFISSQ